MPTSSPLRQFAEAPDRYTDLSADVERFADDRVCVVHGLTWAAVSDVRVEPEELPALVEETRALVPPDRTITWWLGPSSRPEGLFERLQRLGFVEPADRATLLHALASETEPPAADGVEVRCVESFDDYAQAVAIGWEAFGISEERRAKEREHMRVMYEGARDAGVPVAFLAYVDGEPVGVGRSVTSPRGVFLIGGAVLPHARGRGVYRALVRARWDHAVERGTPGMVVEAMPGTSYPILKRLGFEDVCIVRRLEDPR